MATYAYVEQEQIQSLHDVLPENWKNTSNFRALANDEHALNQHGWYTVTKPTNDFDPIEYIESAPTYSFNGHTVVENRQVIFKGDAYGVKHVPETSDPNIQKILKDTLWRDIRQQRDQKMKEFEWRYDRYFREQRLGLPTTDVLETLDSYMQQLADITSTYEHPVQVIWPAWNN